MKVNFLFPSNFKRLGLFILIPSSIIGLVTLFYEYEPTFLDFNMPAIFIDEILRGENKSFIGIVKNNILDEILAIFIIFSSVLVAFSKERLEDEYISKIRLESLVWAVYVNYGILLFSFLFIYDFSFLWVMILNMFTVLLFFIIKFNWQIFKLKQSANYEK
ncbi:hypothetical protein [Tenacibaculum geojense]|uniref:Na(+)-translocating NADH-quinone reductase subunit B n=1 Tax=Tenacibaculum geojense TaxID=915352 RepID=A0ABW3JU02_9FLAO